MGETFSILQRWKNLDLFTRASDGERGHSNIGDRRGRGFDFSRRKVTDYEAIRRCAPGRIMGISGWKIGTEGNLRAMPRAGTARGIGNRGPCGRVGRECYA